MKCYRVFAIIFLTIFCVGSFFARQDNRIVETDNQEHSYCRAVFPQATRISVKRNNPPHYKIFTHDKQTNKSVLSGIAFRTTDLAPEISGYSGPIDLMVGVNLQGAVTNVHLISHRETTTYIKNLNPFFKQFINKTSGDALQVGQDVDAITQATMTSQAITRSIKQGLDIVAAKVLQLQQKTTGQRQRPLPLGQILIPTLLFIAATCGFIFKNALLRRWALFGGFVYLGLIRASMVSVINIANLGLGNLPNFFDLPFWFVLLGLNVVAALVFGNIYCGILCPFAALQEALFTLRKRISRKTFLPSQHIDHFARYIKHIILLTVIGLSLFLKNADIANVEVYVTLFTWTGGFLSWVFLGAMLVAAIIHYRFWCKYFCPIGALNGLLARLSLFKLRIGNQCNLCQHCQKICPTQAILKRNDDRLTIDYPECILCNQCVQGCPQSTIQLRIKHEKN